MKNGKSFQISMIQYKYCDSQEENILHLCKSKFYKKNILEKANEKHQKFQDFGIFTFF